MKIKSKKYIFWIIILIVLLNSIGMSIVLPLLPFIVGKYLPYRSLNAPKMGAAKKVQAANTDKSTLIPTTIC